MKLNIDGNEYGLIWGTRCFMLAENKLNMSVTEILLSIDRLEVMMTLSYCAIQTWLENEDASNVIPFTFPYFCNWIDSQPDQLGADIINSYSDSTYQGKQMKERYESLGLRLGISNEDATNNVKKKTGKP